MDALVVVDVATVEDICKEGRTFEEEIGGTASEGDTFAEEGGAGGGRAADGPEEKRELENGGKAVEGCGGVEGSKKGSRAADVGR